MRSARVERELAAVYAKYPGSQAVEDEDGSITLVIPGYPIPADFDRDAVRVAVKVGVLYPIEKLDLFWLDPTLRRLDGAPLPNVMATRVTLAQQEWTQISWHDNAPHDPQRCTIQGFLHGMRAWFAGQTGDA